MKNSQILLILLIITFFSHGCKEDACEDVSCLNGGTCIDGQCDCPEGYSGLDCGNVETPDLIKVSAVSLIHFPLTESNGGSWDISSGPDIYFRIFEGDELIYDSYYYENATADGEFIWEFTEPISLTEPLLSHSIALYDYDVIDADDFMEVINFTPFDESEGLPAPLILDVGKLTFELEVEYVY